MNLSGVTQEYDPFACRIKPADVMPGAEKTHRGDTEGGSTAGYSRK